MFPADSGVIDMWALGVTPDDGMDDTALINQILAANPGGNKLFYFADGVYNISGSIGFGIDGGVTKRNIFQGQSQAGTVFKLDDNLGFGGVVIDHNLNVPGRDPAQFFRNSIRDLTVDVGTGNPDATGILFSASNQGSLRDVTVRSSDNTGSGIGVRAGGSEPGPMLIKNLTVEGFGTGLLTQRATASQTVENLTLRNQGSVGWLNERTQNVFARGIISDNSVTAIENDGQSRMVLLDSVLKGDSANGGATVAINQENRFFGRNISTPGYDETINANFGSGDNRGNVHAGGGTLVEYWAQGHDPSTFPAGHSRRGGAFELFQSPDTSLGLEVRDTPTVAMDNPNTPGAWAGPHSFGGVSGGQQDVSTALQAAVNSGASTIYLPNGRWLLEGDVTIPSSVKRILGAEAQIFGGGRLILQDGDTPLVIERLEFDNNNPATVTHASGRTLVLQQVLDIAYEATADAPGDLYLEDVNGSAMTFRNQRVWARQLNIETPTDFNDPDSPDAKIVNDGAEVWILGFKTEREGTWVRTINGGKTELLGGVKIGSNGGDSFGLDNAQFVTIDSSLSVANGFLAGTDPSPSTYEFAAVETRDGVTRSLQGDLLGDTDLYTAFTDAVLWEVQRTVILDNADVGVTSRSGTWEISDSRFRGGFIEDTLELSDTPGSTFTFDLTVPDQGLYEVYLRWAHSSHDDDVSIQLLDGEGRSTDLIIDMSDNGGRWNYLTTLELNPEALGLTDNTLTLFVGGDRFVSADGVLIRLVPEPSSLLLLGVFGGVLIMRRRPVSSAHHC